MHGSDGVKVWRVELIAVVVFELVAVELESSICEYTGALRN
jgi:hypothetical protein